MENINIVLLLSRWVHLIGAIVMLGGSVFMLYSLFPSMKESLDDNTRERIRQCIRARWSRFVHAGIGLLLLTGGINFYILGMSPHVKPMPYHAIFGIKFFAAIFLFFIAIALMGRSPAFEKIRRNSTRWLGVVIILGFVIVLLSGLLSQVRATPSVHQDTPQVIRADLIQEP